MDTELQRLHTRIREWEIYAVMVGVGCFLLGVIFGWGLTYFCTTGFCLERGTDMEDQTALCDNCGHMRYEHKLANFYDGSQTGEAFLVCPTATFKDKE